MTTTVQERFLDGRATSQGWTQPMLDPTYGPQMGFAPDLRYWVNNANYKQYNLIPILLEAPRFLQYLNDGDKRVEILRAMVEIAPRSITGLRHSLNVEVDSTPVGGAGELQQEFTDVKRDRSDPIFTWDEKYGRPYGIFLEDWITQGLMDPNTKVANIGTIENGPTDMLPDQYAMSMMFIEPDPMQRRVVRSWVITNMWPQSAGDQEAQRDINQALQLKQLQITFSALQQVGAGVNAVAQTVLDGINIYGANPNLRASFISDVAPEVLAAANGYHPQIQEFQDNAIQIN